MEKIWLKRLKKKKGLGNQQGWIENNIEKTQASCLVVMKKMVEDIYEAYLVEKYFKRKKCVSCVESVAR